MSTRRPVLHADSPGHGPAAATAVGNHVDVEDRCSLYHLVAVLLGAPDAALRLSVPVLAAGVDRLDDAGLRTRLCAFLVWFEASDPQHVLQHHQRTFAGDDACPLGLTAYLADDPVAHEAARHALEETLARHGLSAGGLGVDHLPLVLEVAAALGPGEGEVPLLRHRRGLVRLADRLTERRSPYAHLVGAVVAALPEG